MTGSVMRWTRALPDTVGWYWMRCPWLGVPAPEPTYVTDRHGYLCIVRLTGIGKRDFMPVSKLDAEWAGPLLPPEG